MEMRYGGTKDVSGRGVQVNLLKLMEETEVNLQSQTDLVGQMQAMMDMQRGKSHKRSMNTRHVLFIVSGAFDKLGEIVQKRIASRPIGFQDPADTEEFNDEDFLRSVEARDFIEYGFEPEFIGRLPIRVPCQTLTVDDLEKILTSGEESVLEQYREDFRGYGIEFDITKEALHEVAAGAANEGTGARGLMTVLERLFRDFKFEMPSTQIKSFEVQTDTMADPGAALKALLLENATTNQEALREEVDSFAGRFKKENGIELTFTEDAIEALIAISLETDTTIRAVCESKFKDYEYGLKLISGKTGETRFSINRDAVEDPDSELSKWVVEHYPRES